MVSPLWRWRSWVLVLLLVGPVLAYVGLGMLWLWERGWVACTVGGCALVAHGWRLLDPGRRAGPRHRGRSCRRSTGIRPNFFRRSIAKRGSSCRKRPSKGESLSFDVLLGSDTYIEYGPHVYSGASPRTIIRSRPSRSTMFRWSS